MIDFIKFLFNGYRDNGIRFFSHWVLFWLGEKKLDSYQKYYKGNLVDLGCGDAGLQDYFLKYADKYIGVDWQNNRHHGVSPDVISDLNSAIDLDNDYADTLVAISVMEHLKEPEIFLKESFRVLKKGGFFVLHVPFQWWIHEFPHDYFRYTCYGLEYLLKKINFNVLEIEPVQGFFTMMILKLNYFTVRWFNLPKFIWIIWLYLLSPFWILGQLFAVLLDKLFDRNYSLETSGYWILAKKE